jgi:CHASE3 domain sensor protein
LTNQIFAAILNCETGQRGFLLTGKVEYLEPFIKNKPQCFTLLHQLFQYHSFGSPSYRLVERFQSLIKLKLAELQQTIDLKKYVSLEAALAVVNKESVTRSGEYGALHVVLVALRTH